MDMPILHNFLICFLHTISQNAFFVDVFAEISSSNHLLLNCSYLSCYFLILGQFSQPFERLRISFFFFVFKFPCNCFYCESGEHIFPIPQPNVYSLVLRSSFVSYSHLHTCLNIPCSSTTSTYS